MRWSPEQEDKLIELWLDTTQSCTQIALTIFGTTKAKSAVIGKAHRLKLGLKALPEKVEPHRAWKAKHEERERRLATLYDLLLKNSADGYVRLYNKDIAQFFGIQLKSDRINQWLETLQERGKIVIANRKKVPKVIKVFWPKPVPTVVDEPLPPIRDEKELFRAGFCWCGKTRMKPYQFCLEHLRKQTAA